jgi:hypothetical protein
MTPCRPGLLQTSNCATATPSTSSGGLSICTVLHCHHQGLADFGERPEVAWHAIVEHLYTSPQPSPPGAGGVFGSYRVEAFFSSWSPPMASAPGRVRQVMASTSS